MQVTRGGQNAWHTSLAKKGVATSSYRHAMSLHSCATCFSLIHASNWRAKGAWPCQDSSLGVDAL